MVIVRLVVYRFVAFACSYLVLSLSLRRACALAISSPLVLAALAVLANNSDSSDGPSAAHRQLQARPTHGERARLLARMRPYGHMRVQLGLDRTIGAHLY